MLNLFHVDVLIWGMSSNLKTKLNHHIRYSPQLYCTSHFTILTYIINITIVISFITFINHFFLVRRCFIVLQHNISLLALNIWFSQSIFHQVDNEPLVSQSASQSISQSVSHFLHHWVHVNDSDSGSACQASDNDSASL